ncbi:hypothetical protein EPN96_00250 [bacterium]|nr:MAG: hypothetical protein EPN96_00250 [bacterium]
MKKKLGVISLVATLLLVSVFAQARVREEWTNYLSNPTISQFSELTPSADGGFYAITNYYGPYYGLNLARIEADGTVSWELRYGEFYPHIPPDFIRFHHLKIGNTFDLKALPDGGVSAISTYSDISDQVGIPELNDPEIPLNGYVISFFTIDGLLTGTRYIPQAVLDGNPIRTLEIDFTTDGGFLVRGECLYEVVVVKYDSEGNLSWMTPVGFRSSYLSSSALAADGGVFVRAFADGGAYFYSVRLVRIGPNGEIIYDFIGDPCDDRLDFSRLIPLPDGALLEVVGLGQGNHYESSSDFMVRQCSPEGVCGPRTALISFRAGHETKLRDVKLAPDGDIIAIGLKNRNGDKTGEPLVPWILKASPAGEKAFEATFGGAYEFENVMEVLQIADGNFLVTGFGYTDYLFEGRTRWGNLGSLTLLSTGGPQRQHAK